MLETRHGPRFHEDGSVTFRVWAPHAERVELVLADEKHELSPHSHGWYSVRVPASHGDDYGYRLDGGQTRPDPASRWQPYGVHELSRLFDPSRLSWHDGEAAWRAPPLAGAVVYELHIGTFTPEGTLEGALLQLPALADLGVTHVELMPVNAFNGEAGWGYDGAAWYAVHEPYGGPEAFARFVDAAHQSGLAVVLDVVYNHLGPSGNYLPEFGPYQTDRYRTPWGEAINFDGPGSDPVRAFVLDNALYWLTAHRVDGLRLDAVHGLVDTSARHILSELSEAVDTAATAQGRPLELIAESDRCDPATVLPRAVGGMGMDAQWSDDLHHAIHTAVTGETDGYYADYAGLVDVAAAYRKGWLFDGNRYSAHRGRTVGQPLPDEVSGRRLVACIQNHDQVGNRALGERLTTLVDPALARVAAVLLAAAPHVPMLFMGEEYGETRPFQYFSSHPEPELAEAVRHGRREEFAAFAAFAGEVPDPQDPATVERSSLDRSRTATDSGRAWQSFWQEVLTTRREQPALCNGRRDLVEAHDVDETGLAVTRGDPWARRVLVTVTLREDRSLVVPGGPWRRLLSSQDPRYGGNPAAVPDDPHGPAGGPSAALWVEQT